MSIKYYHLAKDEELPEEFCAIRDEGGEPNGYVFYMPESEVAKLREQTELLVTLLRNDCDIEASWDGLRHFWSIELTEDGCLMRDRACKAEAENAKLREYIERKKVLQDYARMFDNNAKLRKLVKQMHNHIKESCDICNEDYCSSWDEDNECCIYDTLTREVGIEVDE